MLSNIVLAAILATLGSTLPQAPAIAPAPAKFDPASIPPALPVPRGVAPNFRLINWHSKERHTRDYWTTCWNDDLTPTPKDTAWQDTMQGCLNNYNVPNWDGQECGGVGWYKAHHTYENPQHCWNACKGCIEWFINGTSTKGACWTSHGASPPNFDGGAPIAYKHLTWCDMGYHELEGGTPSTSTS